MLVFAFIFIALCIMIAVLINISNKDEKKNRAKHAATRRLEMQAKQDSYKAEVKELKKQYGEISVDILTQILEDFNIDKHVYVFEGSKILYVNNEPIHFEKILDCELKDNQTTITKTTSPKYQTSTNTGSMVGRAIVGGILTGGVGAVVGAATASKTTKVVDEGKTTTIVTGHNYCITINIDDLSNPIRVVKFSYNREGAEKMYNVLKVIMHRTHGIVLNS